MSDFLRMFRNRRFGESRHRNGSDPVYGGELDQEEGKYGVTKKNFVLLVAATTAMAKTRQTYGIIASPIRVSITPISLIGNSTAEKD